MQKPIRLWGSSSVQFSKDLMMGFPKGLVHTSTKTHKIAVEKSFPTTASSSSRHRMSIWQSEVWHRSYFRSPFLGCKARRRGGASEMRRSEPTGRATPACLHPAILLHSYLLSLQLQKSNCLCRQFTGCPHWTITKQHGPPYGLVLLEAIFVAFVWRR